MTGRIALYFSPVKSSALNHFGEALLGRTNKAARNENSQSSFPNQSKWKRLTEKPAHYGFHATLKAPFEISKNKTLDMLIQEVEAFAKTQSPHTLNTLGPSELSNFMALTVSEQSKGLADFAFQCVTKFEDFRKPLSESDIARRKQQTLSKRQLELLNQFGYPYIDDEFRFHMTLSGQLAKDDHDFHAWASSLYSEMVKEVPVLDQLCLFTQEDRKSAFVEVERFSLGDE